ALQRAGLLAAQDHGDGLVTTTLQIYNEQADCSGLGLLGASASITSPRKGPAAAVAEQIRRGQEVHIGRAVHELHAATKELIALLKTVEKESPATQSAAAVAAAASFSSEAAGGSFDASASPSSAASALASSHPAFASATSFSPS